MKNKILPFLLGVACVSLIAAGVSRQPFYAAGPTQVETGTSVITTDGTVTNTFSPAYSSAPKVFVTQTGLALLSATNAVASITPSNCVLRSSLSGTTNNWLAVGTP